jgi:hypothetical protein
MDISHEKGNKFEVEVETIIRDVVTRIKAQLKAEFRAEVIPHPRLMGACAEWRPDLALMASSLFDSMNPSLELAIIECKYVDDSSSEGTYWTQMSRAYMTLNDLRLAGRESLAFYLTVNRHNAGMRRDYSEIFRGIGTKLVNIHVLQERVRFESDMKRLLEESTWEQQTKKLKSSLKALKEE